MSYGVNKPEISSQKIKISERRYIFLIANFKIKHKINLLEIWEEIRFVFYYNKYNTSLGTNDTLFLLGIWA